MSERALVRLLIVVTIVAAAVRLLAVLGLHPLNWDEIEYFRATDWVRQGLTPYRNFWEHHTPLQWYVFAPFAAMTKSPGAAAIVWMRVVQIPLWIATFWLANVWMKRAGLSATGRWTAIALATCSSMFMLAAVEYRVDVLACALYVAALVALSVPSPRARGEGAQSADEGPLTRPSATLSPLTRGEGSASSFFAAGVLLCLAGFANLRMGPLLALTVVLGAVTDRAEQRWRFNKHVTWVVAGVIATAALVLGYFALRGALLPMYQHVWVENYLGDKYAQRIAWGFAHRILVPFGIRIYGGAGAFEWTGVDLAGIAVLILGAIGAVRALARARRPDEMFFLAVLQLASVLFIARMKFVYHYHLEIVVVMMLPFIAATVERISRRELVSAFAVISLVISSAALIFRGKEHDFAYQDLIMREADAHTVPQSKVFDGVGWALRRSPAYQFWFLPDLVRQLVAHGQAPPYRVAEWIADPPGAVITDRNASVWLAQNAQLGVYVIHHYVPLWRNLWLPGLSVRLDAEHAVAQWVAPVDGDYRIVASTAVSEHPWFAHPFAYRADANNELRADAPAGVTNLIWYVNQRPAAPLRGRLQLRKGDLVNVVSMLREPIGIFLLPGSDALWFREPEAGATLDAAASRVTHVPDLRLLVSAPIPTSSASPSAPGD